MFSFCIGNFLPHAISRVNDAMACGNASPCVRYYYPDGISVLPCDTWEYRANSIMFYPNFYYMMKIVLIFVVYKNCSDICGI